jgi:hypothetical protein
MKLSKITKLTLLCGLLASTTVIFAKEVHAGTTASATATFSGTVLPSCTVTTSFGGLVTYTNGAILGLSGGVKTLAGQSSLAAFNCNSDTVTVGAIVSVTQPPIPLNATAIKGVHTATIIVTPSFTLLTGQTGDLGTVSAPTDVNGNVSARVISSWVGGEDLLDGGYTASIAVNITAN